MRWFIEILAVTLVVGGLTGCDKPSAGGVAQAAGAGGTASPNSELDPNYGHLTHAQPKLPTIKVWLGAEEVTAEIARTAVQIATGMMFRTNMAEGEAMLFVFPPAMVGPKNFYMRNCFVPLSAAYIQPDGVIAEIVDLNLGDEIGVQSKSLNLQFVLEVPQGWFTRHNVRPGMLVRTERGSLQESFFSR